MKPVLLSLAILLIAACSTTPKQIHCDRHLVPINPTSGQVIPPSTLP